MSAEAGVDDGPIVSVRDVHRDYPVGAERVHALQGHALAFYDATRVFVWNTTKVKKEEVPDSIGLLYVGSDGGGRQDDRRG